MSDGFDELKKGLNNLFGSGEVMYLGQCPSCHRTSNFRISAAQSMKGAFVDNTSSMVETFFDPKGKGISNILKTFGSQRGQIAICDNCNEKMIQCTKCKTICVSSKGSALCNKCNVQISSW